RDEREWRRDHLVARSDLGCQQRKMQSARTGVHADADLRPGECGELLLELRHLAAERELARVENALNCSIDLVLDACVLSFQVDEWDHSSFLTFCSLGDARSASRERMETSAFRSIRSEAAVGARTPPRER